VDEIELTGFLDPSEVATKRKKSFFYFNGHEKEVATLLKDQQTGIKLNTRQIIVAQHILASSLSSDKVVSNAVISDELHTLHKIPKASIRGYISALVKAGILKPVRATCHGEDDKNTTVYRFSTVSEITQISNFNKLNDEETRGNHSETRTSVKTLLGQNSLTSEDVDAKRYLPGKDKVTGNFTSLYFHEDLIPSELISLAPKRSTGKDFSQQEFTQKHGVKVVAKYMLEARAHRQVATQFSFQVLAAILNLAIAFNAKMLNTGQYQEAFQEKAVPITMVDILFVLGIKDSGPVRARVYRSILALRDTIYNKTDLIGTYFDEKTTIFNQKDFQYFVGLESNSTVAPKLDDEGRVVSVPCLFFIQLNDAIAKTIPDFKYLFGIPSKVVVGNALTFLLYLTFRKRRVYKESLLLESVKDAMHYIGTPRQLKKELIKDLDKNYRLSESDTLVEGFDYDYNLCGYYLRFCTNPDGEELIYVVADEKEMITRSGATYNTEPGFKNAPTLPNPLHVETKNVEEIKKENKVKLFISRLKNEFMTEATVRSPIHKKFIINEGMYHLCAYDNDTHIERLAQIFEAMTNIDFDTALASLLVVRSELKFITYGQMEVDRERFFEFKDYLHEQMGIKLSLQEFMDVVKNYRKSGVVNWVGRNYEELGASIAEAYS